VQAIYANANTALKKPTILKKLITNIDELDWYSAKEEGLGDLYEELLEKNATEKKSGAGQYFTPRDFTYTTSNKQLAFLQHIYRGLKPGGRAAVVLPDNVLFEDGQGRAIRADLMEKCNLHTILRLPTGIFYSPGVKTNVLFFQRGMTEKGNTAGVWVYDLRTNMPSFGKRTPLTRGHFQPFMDVYGDEPNGGSQRVDEGESGRWRCFSREEIAKRGDNLDLSWLRDESLQSADDSPKGTLCLRQAKRQRERARFALK
jgi:type I restriction-modification system DNA methylase subunit